MYKKAIKTILIISFTLLFLIATLNFVIDPFFHYRKPLNGLAYILQEERYQNNGILKNYDYDAIIAGSSMSENFKTSQLDKLFNTNSIKVSCSGSVSSYKEVNEEIEVAYKCGKDLKMVIRSIDVGALIEDKDAMRYDDSFYPTYLYDNNPFNDINYLLNKQVLTNSVAVLYNTIIGNETTSFDDYANWMHDAEFGKDAIGYDFAGETNKEQLPLTSNEIQIVTDNVTQNFYDIAKKHPETEFYYFFTPYSICYMDREYNDGTLLKQFEAMKVATKIFNELDNVHIFTYFDLTDYISDLNNYRDIYHYSEDMNEFILLTMKNGEYELNKNNYIQIINNQIDYYCNFDYLVYK